MKRIKLLLLSAFVCFGMYNAMAQTKVSGQVTSSEDGQPIPGVTVIVKGLSGVGTSTNIEGKYFLTVPSAGKILVFSYIGYQPQDISLDGKSTINVVLVADSKKLDEVVVTALGISRSKKSLGYSIQEVSGDKVNTVKESNFINSLSGKVTGVQIKPSNTMGGSANIVIRGASSLLNSNQALFVIDGVPVDNSNTNSAGQMSGRGGYDFGNAAMDVNTEDIESISVLKGAASAALYGSRAANGVVLITTKKGSKKKGMGVSVSSNIQFSSFDESTMPKIQKEYGAGYGASFIPFDINGDGIDEDLCPTSDDASWGYKFDPNKMVVQWKNLNPASPDYGVATPWVAGAHDYRYFFRTGVNYTNSVSVEGSNELGSFRLAYSNSDETGLLPNSSFKKNTISLNSSLNVNKKVKIDANANFTQNKGLGRYGTGYNAGNPMSSFGEWFQSNVDFKELSENYITKDGRQLAWNYGDPTVKYSPAHYWDNPYWLRYKNYENDKRNRFFGYTKLSYEILSGLTFETRASEDFYSELQEERWAAGSSDTNGNPYYTKYQREFSEFNLESYLRYNKTFTDFSLNGLLGSSWRNQSIISTFASTSGGLAVPDLYAISNSKSAATVTESEIPSSILSGFANVSVGWKNLIYIEATGRVDKSSTLPDKNNTFFYPSVSLSFVLSELDMVRNLSFLSFSKIRGNYAEVGNSAPAQKIYNAFDVNKPWGTQPTNSVGSTFYNPILKPEKSKTLEFGFESRFLKDRIGFDIAIYRKNSFDQIVPISISRASGLNSMYMNVGKIENKGIEVTLNAKPVLTNNFKWDVNINWFANRNQVVDLGGSIKNITLFSAWDVSVNATEGEPYGTIKGRNFIFKDGKTVVYSPADEAAGLGKAGMYKRSDQDEILGNVNPVWNGGITNTFSYKGFSLSTLIDIQHGGSIYSVGNKYGMSTGLYEQTAGLNDKGNPKRDLVSKGGGIIFSGSVYADGTPNKTYIEANTWATAYDYDVLPTAQYVYDASYVKFREMTFSYKLASSIIKKTPFTAIELSVVGRNLWIISKNTPGFDPEASLSSGNLQGIEYGCYPTTKTYGFNIKVNF
jgi:TonB-linked SusC/RagA family outer membrane protein